MSIDKGKAAIIYRVKSLAKDSLKHPLEFSKLLYQVGFESTTKISTAQNTILTIQRIVDNIIYVKNTDGYRGCYKGLTAKLCENIVGSIATKKMLTYIDKDNTIKQAARCSNKYHKKENLILTNFQKKNVVAKRLLAISFASILASHPFRVVSLRMMAQFVGKEAKYNNILKSVLTIYKEEGIFGIYSGVVPKITGEILEIIINIYLTHLLCKFFETSNKQLMCTHATRIMGCFIKYPFENVSNCMAINNSGLAAASTPYFPNYTSWIQCWSHLYKNSRLTSHCLPFLLLGTELHSSF